MSQPKLNCSKFKGTKPDFSLIKWFLSTGPQNNIHVSCWFSYKSFEISSIIFTKLKQKYNECIKNTEKLGVVSPVPADIDSANSVEPFHISKIAKELNLGQGDFIFIFLWWDLCNIMQWLFSCFLLIDYVEHFEWCRCFSSFLLIVYVKLWPFWLV